MAEPLVSVVMSAFNNADSVSAAMEGILAQTLSDWELIVVNDGSTDGTGTILDRYAAADRRIAVIHQANVGLTLALIRGCAAAKGTYIARHDADDVSYPERLRRQADVLAAESGISMVSCAVLWVGPGGEPLQLVKRPTDPAEATKLLVKDREGPAAHGAVMFRRSTYAAVGGYRPEFYYSQDNDLWLRLTERGQLQYLDECLYQMRRSPVSISGTQRKSQWAFGAIAFDCRAARDRGEPEAAILERAAELASEIRGRRALQTGKVRPSCEMTYIIGTQLVRNGDGRARKYLWSVLRQRPWHWRAWARMLQSSWSTRSWRSTSRVATS